MILKVCCRTRAVRQVGEAVERNAVAPEREMTVPDLAAVLKAKGLVNDADLASAGK
jgi:hypothetical protein